MTKRQVVRAGLKTFGYDAAAEDCDETNVERYAAWLVRHVRSAATRINVETRKTTINRDLMRKADKLERDLAAL